MSSSPSTFPFPYLLVLNFIECLWIQLSSWCFQYAILHFHVFILHLGLKVVSFGMKENIQKSKQIISTSTSINIKYVFGFIPCHLTSCEVLYRV